MELAPSLFLVVMSLLMVALPRHHAIAPMLMTAVLMTIGPEIVIGGASFTIMRIVILVAMLRVILRGEAKGLSFGPIDRAILVWAIVAVVIEYFPIPRDPRAVLPIRTFMDKVVSSGRFIVDFGGMFYVGRCLIRSPNDVRFMVRVLIVLAAILSCFMVVESFTGRNSFSVLGGVNEYSAYRNGRYRAQGSFTHSIHAGTFGAILFPLCLGAWTYMNKKWSIMGIAASTLVVIASTSSGPLMSWVFGLIAFSLWTVRAKMKQIRIGLVVVIVVAEVGMKSHFWWLIAKIADIVGGGGYWRAKLIDQFVTYFQEWWLVGTDYTAHWSPTGVGLPTFPDHMDLTNQYVAEGVNGGLLRLILFVVVIIAGFRCAGRIAGNLMIERRTRIMFWALGSSLCAFCMAFLSVSNSSQNSVIYYCLLASLSMTPVARKTSQRSNSFTTGPKSPRRKEDICSRQPRTA